MADGDDAGCECPCAGCLGCARRGRGSSGSSAAATGAAAGAPGPSAAVPPRGISGGAPESGGAGAAGRARSTPQQRQYAARRQQQYRHRQNMLLSAVFGPDPGPVGSLVAPVDARIPAATVRAMMQQHWRDASHQAQAALREKDRERRRMSEEIAALQRQLETERRERAAERRDAAERRSLQRRTNARRLAMQLARVGFRLLMAKYTVGGGGGCVRKPGTMLSCPGSTAPADADPDAGVAWDGSPEGETVLDLRYMTGTGLKTGSLRSTLPKEIQRLDAGDYIAAVAGRDGAVLVQLEARPVQIPFGQVGGHHVAKEGLSGPGRGFSVPQGRAILRKIISLETRKWFEDTDMVWWLEWNVVSEI